MKSLNQFIQEQLVIKEDKNNYKYFPKTKEELRNLIKQRIYKEDSKVNLNDIDVSKITDMSSLFEDISFRGDISKWDVSNVTDMHRMFYKCEIFNQDISGWDVSNIKNRAYTFYKCPIKEKYKPRFK